MTETTTMNDIRMMTINEAAERVPGLTKYRIREMCIKNEVPHLKAGRKYLICEQVLIRYLTEPRTTPPSEPERKMRRIS